MKKAVILFFSLLAFFKIEAQDAKFTVTVSTDSILMNNYFQVAFTLENAEGKDFEAPDFTGFELVSGPNMSTSISMMNGRSSQTVTYSYYLKPLDIGNYFIAAASIKTEEKYLETAPIEVIVVPNPDGIIQNPQMQQSPNPFGGFNDFFGNDNFFKLDDFFQNIPEDIHAQPDMKTPQAQKKKRKTYKL